MGRLTDPLPDNVEICECGHCKEWHSESGFCLIAIDIDQECECKQHRPKFVLLDTDYFSKAKSA